MAAIGTLPVVLGTGIHSARPAASAVGKGGLYSCTTHSLVYQTDGSSWTTWATLGAAASGSITSSGYTQNTARLLGRTTGSSGAIEEITVGTGLSLSAGALTATGGSSGVATDAIWTTAGMVAVGTGTATATEQWPPGHEFDYVGSSGTSSITATSEATATTIITANAVTYDGSTVIMIEFFCPEIIPASSDNAFVRIVLYDGSSSIGYFGIVFNPKVVSSGRWPVHLMRRLTPSAAAHTYSVRGYVNTGTGEANGSSGGTAAYVPVFIRQYKV